MKRSRNIHPVFERVVKREDKEKLLKQHAKVIWLTGLSGAGKTTLGATLEQELFKRGFLTQMLDGDNIRSGLNKNLGFGLEDRLENIRRIAEISKLFLNAGVITINCFITPTEAMRQMARDIVGANDYIEIYVNAPLEVCEQRDVKGLYKKARQGLIKNFTGIDSPFEPPKNPDLEIRTDQLTVEQSVQKILEYVLPKITMKNKPLFEKR